MPSRDPITIAPDDSQGSRLEQLVFQALERRAQGGAAALEAFVAGHPEDAAALRAELERLGEGGMGVVFAAEQISLKRPVALKLVRPEQLGFAGARERFRREVEAAARLQHPGIVPVYVVGEQDGLPFFAMERLDGCTLADLLRELAGRDPAQLSGADLARAAAWAAARSASPPTRASAWPPAPGPATCASSRTPSRAPSCARWAARPRARP